MLGKIFIIFFIILLPFLLVFIINYYQGKSFHSCKKCKENEYFYIDVSLPSNEIINELELDINKKGTILDKKYNFNNSQGKKINYNEISDNIINFYLVEKYRKLVSRILKEEVYFADDSEQYKIFARLYDNENDFLDWHYDNNFTEGNRYTLVIPLKVSSNNTSEFMIKDRKTKEEKIIPIPIGKGIIYNGSKTYHKISNQRKGEKRLVLIIPFYSNYNKTNLGKFREKTRNFTYKKFKL